MNSIKQTNGLKIFTIIFFLISIVIYHLIFSRYFPNKNNGLGSDYSYFLPYLLNGYYWYQVNGLFEVPWFTPAFCGGVPFFPNPQTMYYSFPQFLTLFFDPFRSVYITFIIFALLGYIGFYRLLKDIFLVKPEVAVLGSILFLFNGFYAHRLIIGHLTYHSFMLIPMIAYFLLLPSCWGRKSSIFNTIFCIVLAGLLITYMFQSGAANFIMPALLSVCGIWLLYEIKEGRNTKFGLYFVCSIVVAICLSASKLVSALYFLRNFSRDQYLLPGIDGFYNSFIFILNLLFFKYEEGMESVFVNTPFTFQRHEFEYSVTIVPVFIFCIYIVLVVKDYFRVRKEGHSIIISRSILKILMFSFVVIIPILLNTFTNEWNAILKSLPYIKHSSSLIRWNASNISLVILMSALSLNAISNQKIRYFIFGVSFILIIIINVTSDRNYYDEQYYSPQKIINGYRKTKIIGAPPAIEKIGAYIDENGRYALSTIGGNDILTVGVSQLACYEPILGYMLEKFPHSHIHLGSVMNVNNNHLNIINPVCYFFDKKNQCKPGDLFSTKHIEDASAFLHYQPFNFKIPFTQKLANIINVISVIMTGLFIIAFFCRVFFIRLQK